MCPWDRRPAGLGSRILTGEGAGPIVPAMKNLYAILAVCLVFGLTFVSAGCSISHSVKSSSTSIGNSSDSSSDSSSSSSADDEDKDDDGDGEGEAAPDTSYRDDARDYTAAYVTALKDAGAGANDAAAAGAAAAGGVDAAADGSADTAADGSADAAAGPKIDVDAFRKGLSGVAAKYAITDWEVDDDTYAGIGSGLAKVNVTSEEFAAYSAAFSGGDAAKAAAIKRGYDGQG